MKFRSAIFQWTATIANLLCLCTPHTHHSHITILLQWITRSIITKAWILTWTNISVNTRIKRQWSRTIMPVSERINYLHAIVSTFSFLSILFFLTNTQSDYAITIIYKELHYVPLEMPQNCSLVRFKWLLRTQIIAWCIYLRMDVQIRRFSRSPHPSHSHLCHFSWGR